MTDASSRRLRRDAEANRQRLLAAATELFARRGLDVTLNDIAHHAGVGVGTAYRRFANKEEVVDALFEQRIEEVAELAARALDDDDAWRGLRTFIEESLRMQAEDRGLSEIMNNPALARDRVAESRDRIGPLVDAMVARAKDQGTLRPDVEGTDMILIQVALAAIMGPTRDIAPDLYRRYFTIFLDGLRAHRGSLSPLPVGPLTVNETHRIMTQAMPDGVPALP